MEKQAKAHKSSTEILKELTDKVDYLQESLDGSLEAMKTIVLRVAQLANQVASLEDKMQKNDIRYKATIDLLTSSNVLDLESLKEKVLTLKTDELSSKVEAMVKAGLLEKQDQIEDDSFIVFKELNETGQEISARTQMAIVNMDPADGNLLRGRSIGDLVNMGEGRTQLFIQEIYKIVSPKQEEESQVNS